MSRQIEKLERPVRRTEKVAVQCQHRHRRYVINEIEYKMWRCLDCGLLQRENTH